MSVDKAAYYLALDGVTQYGLTEGVKAILKGALGHAFFPTPPELRIQCDKAMKPHEDYRQRAWQRERNRFPPEPPRKEPTPEERARVAALMADFHATMDDGKATGIAAERADIRARYGMTDEVLAGIRDAPAPMPRISPPSFKRSA